MRNFEWVSTVTVVICATVAVTLKALDPVAYAGILGAAIGYTGKGVVVTKTEGEQ